MLLLLLPLAILLNSSVASGKDVKVRLTTTKGQPLLGGMIVAKDSNQKIIASGKTGSDGIALLKNLPPSGTVKIEATSPIIVRKGTETSTGSEKKIELESANGLVEMNAQDPMLTADSFDRAQRIDESSPAYIPANVVLAQAAKAKSKEEKYIFVREAVNFRQMDILKPLVEMSFPVNPEKADSFSALHMAVDHDWEDGVKLLISKGADLDSRFSGKTPLYYAVKRKNSVIAKMLIAAGADPDLPDLAGVTPLHLAVFNNDLETVKALLRVVEKESPVLAGETTPLSLARELHYKEIEKEILKTTSEKLDFESRKTPRHIGFLITRKMNPDGPPEDEDAQKREVYEVRGNKFRVKSPQGDDSWIDRPANAEYKSVEEFLKRERLALSDRRWNKVFYDKPGGVPTAKKELKDFLTLEPVKMTTLHDGLREIPSREDLYLEVLETRRIKEDVWLRVRIRPEDDFGETESKVFPSGWIKLHDELGRWVVSPIGC